MTSRKIAQNLKFLIIALAFSIALGCKDAHRKQPDPDMGLERAEKACVERIFEKDSVLGGIRNRESENISLSQTIKNYTRGLDSLDYTDCPEKFVTSFKEHIVAWKAVTKVTDKYPELRGEMHEVFKELEKSKDSIEFKSLVKKVWDTWSVVEESTK